MKESVDFIKVKDYAVININNMIPVPKEQLIELDITTFAKRTNDFELLERKFKEY